MSGQKDENSVRGFDPSGTTPEQQRLRQLEHQQELSVSVTKHKKTYITHVIGNINSLKPVNEIIKKELSQHIKHAFIPKHTIVKKLFEEDEPDIEQGDSGGSLPIEEGSMPIEEQKSSEDKGVLELEVSSQESQIN